jgi:hypothetical protein
MNPITHFQLPDSNLCKAAIEYACTVSEPFLFHHVMRSAIYADRIGQSRKMKYDREVVCVSAILHDLGLTKIAPVRTRFEIEGADAAKEFLAQQGMSERSIETVWMAISLHSTTEIPQYMSPEIALCQLGIAADLNILPSGIVTDEILDEVMSDYPWLDIGESLVSTLIGLYKKNPKAAMSNAVADACERGIPGFKRFNLCDHLLNMNEELLRERRRQRK